MDNLTQTSYSKELVEKIQYLYKALDECKNIVHSLQLENDSLKKVCKTIDSQINYPDLSKIKGD